MFEQALEWENHSTNRSWTVMLGFTWQAALVGLAILGPLIWPESLPKGSWLPDWRRPLVPYRGAVKLVPAPRGSIARTKAPTRPFDASRLYEPRAVPGNVAMIVEEPAGGSIGTGLSGPYINGLEGLGIPGVSVADRVIMSIPVSHTPPPAPAPRAAKAEPREPLRVGGQVQAAKIVKQVLPLYPPLARQARVAGTVRLIGIIARDGSIQRLEVVSGHPLLVGAALEAVRQWVYHPTLLNGEPVEVVAPIDVIFTLNQ